MPLLFPSLLTLYVTLMTIPLMTFGEVTSVHAQVQCWAARQHEGSVSDKRASRLVKAMDTAESLLKQSHELLNSPIPIRMRTTMVARLRDAPGSRLIVRAYPEKTLLGIALWQGDCALISQVDRVTESFGQISIFFNDVSQDLFSTHGEPPKLTGTIAGYPEYNGRIVISKDGRLPWIPQTLRERLDQVGAAREKALKDWQRTQFSRKAPDPGAVERTAALLRKTDAEGAEKYLANMNRLASEIQSAQARDTARLVHLTTLRDEYRAYRNSFTAEELAMPVVWGDVDGSARRAMEAQIDALQELSVEAQQRLGEIREQSRSLEREAAGSDNEAQAVRLRSQARDLLQDADNVRKDHVERATLEEEKLRGRFELVNLKPGPAEHALAYKLDPTFPGRHQPGKIEVIIVSISAPSEERFRQTPEQAARKTWLDRVRSSLDYAALAALLD